MKCNEFTIVFSSDNRGILPLRMALHSLLTTAKPETFYKIHILSDGLDEGNTKSIKETVSRFNCYLNIIDVANILKKHDFPYTENLPMAAWSRIFIPELLSEESGKALYLDIDVLVCQDLTDLFATDISGKALGVVYENFTHRGGDFNQRLGIPLTHTKYFNSGVLLMNLDVFREKHLSEAVARYAAENREKLIAFDQDALNAVLYDLATPMHPRWNWNDRQTKRMLRRTLDEPFWNCATPQQEIEAASNPGIVHYLGPHKPWRYNWRYEGARYEKALRAAGLLQGHLPGRTFPAILKKYLYKPVYWLIAKKMARFKYQLEQDRQLSPPPQSCRCISGCAA
ncbi:MAG: glycosyltransferase family 8 protein [Ottowia sp.]|nr:glycosyltransferase family 8 protein [Ottowia sp.]